MLNTAQAVYRFLDTQPLGHLAEDNVPEEGLGREVGHGGIVQQHVAGRAYHIVEFGADDILQQDGTGTLVPLHIGIVGQVQGNHLHTRIGLSGIVEGVAGEDIGTGSGLEGLVSVLAGKILLEFIQAGDILHQHFRLGLVLQKDKSLIGTLQAEKLVVVRLVRAQDQVHLAVVHLQPVDIALVVVVGAEGLHLAQQVFLHAGLDGDVGRSRQVIGNLVDMLAIRVMEPDGLQSTVFPAADKRIGAVLVRIVEGGEFRFRHVGRIEIGAGKAILIALYEGYAVGAVPRAILDFHIGLLGRILDSLQQGLFVAEILLPVHGVQLGRREAVQVQHLFSIIGDAAQIRRIEGYGGVIRHFPRKRRFFLHLAGTQDRQRQRGQNQYFSHID